MSDNSNIYKEKTIESAINTIVTKMNDIFGLSKEEKTVARRRWIWELIQNASDCADVDRVKIKIEVTENELIFSHDGAIFTYKNLMDLITQISSKRSQTKEQTGKFGTGFISTHLISPIINIEGIYHFDEHSTEFKALDLVIDRSNLDEQCIRNSVEMALNNLDSLVDSPNVVSSLEKGFNTRFIYKFSNNAEALDAIKIGIEDLDRCIGYVFAFNKKIKEVQYNSVTYSLEETEVLEHGIIKRVIRSFDTITNENTKKMIVCCESADKKATIAMELIKEQQKYKCKDISNIPKLFCTFPLIGTEDFPFPIVVNSDQLEISQERNSVHESDNNKSIIEYATESYQILLSYVNKENCTSLFNICKMNKPNSTYSKKSWKELVFLKIENIYLNTEIISCIYSDGTQNKVKFKDNDVINLNIPYMEKEEYRDEFWELVHRLKTKPLPLKTEYLEWSKLLPVTKINTKLVFEALLNSEECGFNTLLEKFNTSKDMIKWLNTFYDLCMRSNVEIRTLPNQKDEFIDVSKLKSDDVIDESLKDILLYLGGGDIRASLISKEITLNDSVIKSLSIASYNNQLVANKIAEKVREKISKEGSGDKRTHEVQNVFNKLTDWFVSYPEQSKELFKDVYENRFQLTTREETIRRLEVATKVEKTITENNIDLEQALSVIQNSAQLIQLIENGKLIANEETQKLLHHISISSKYAKEKIDIMIKRSICEVHKELSNNPKYIVADNLEEWMRTKYSTTVFQAKRSGTDIRIIVRPSDDNKIIFYEDTELDALDDVDYELWTCNENCKVRILTLGDILKTTGINTIPLRKI